MLKRAREIDVDEHVEKTDVEKTDDSDSKRSKSDSKSDSNLDSRHISKSDSCIRFKAPFSIRTRYTSENKFRMKYTDNIVYIQVCKEDDTWNSISMFSYQTSSIVKELIDQNVITTSITFDNVHFQLPIDANDLNKKMYLQLIYKVAIHVCDPQLFECVQELIQKRQHTEVQELGKLNNKGWMPIYTIMKREITLHDVHSYLSPKNLLFKEDISCSRVEHFTHVATVLDRPKRLALSILLPNDIMDRYLTSTNMYMVHKIWNDNVRPVFELMALVTSKNWVFHHRQCGKGTNVNQSVRQLCEYGNFGTYQKDVIDIKRGYHMTLAKYGHTDYVKHKKEYDQAYKQSPTYADAIRQNVDDETDLCDLIQFGGPLMKTGVRYSWRYVVESFAIRHDTVKSFLPYIKPIVDTIKMADKMRDVWVRDNLIRLLFVKSEWGADERLKKSDIDRDQIELFYSKLVYRAFRCLHIREWTRMIANSEDPELVSNLKTLPRSPYWFSHFVAMIEHRKEDRKMERVTSYEHDVLEDVVYLDKKEGETVEKQVIEWLKKERGFETVVHLENSIWNVFFSIMFGDLSDGNMNYWIWGDLHREEIEKRLSMNKEELKTFIVNVQELRHGLGFGSTITWSLIHNMVDCIPLELFYRIMGMMTQHPENRMGFPDLCGLKDGSFECFEVKAPKDVLHAHQRMWIDVLHPYCTVIKVRWNT